MIAAVLAQSPNARTISIGPRIDEMLSEGILTRLGRGAAARVASRLKAICGCCRESFEPMDFLLR